MDASVAGALPLDLTVHYGASKLVTGDAPAAMRCFKHLTNACADDAAMAANAHLFAFVSLACAQASKLGY